MFSFCGFKFTGLSYIDDGYTWLSMAVELVWIALEVIISVFLHLSNRFVADASRYVVRSCGGVCGYGYYDFENNCDG